MVFDLIFEFIQPGIIIVVVIFSAKNPFTSQMYDTQAIIKDVEKKIDCFSPELAITGRLSHFSHFGSLFKSVLL